MRGLIHSLTPRGWLLAVLAALAVLAVVFTLPRVLGFRWDPLDLAGRRLRAEQARTVTLSADLHARRLERDEAETARIRAETRHALNTELARATAAAEILSRTADDADHPLDPARLERLRAHDRKLCELSPGLCADRSAAGAPAS